MTQYFQEIWRKTLKRWTLLIFFLVPFPINAKMSDQTVDFGLDMWMAFQCASLAQKLEGQSTERNRLLTHGFKQGLELVKLAKQEGIELELTSKVPPLVQFYLIDGGPSPDFILGRIYQSAMNGVYEDLLRDTSSIQVTKDRAKARFQEQNCSQIGR